MKVYIVISTPGEGEQGDIIAVYNTEEDAKKRVAKEPKHTGTYEEHEVILWGTFYKECSDRKRKEFIKKDWRKLPIHSRPEPETLAPTSRPDMKNKKHHEIDIHDVDCVSCERKLLMSIRGIKMHEITQPYYVCDNEECIRFGLISSAFSFKGKVYISDVVFKGIKKNLLTTF